MANDASNKQGPIAGDLIAFYGTLMRGLGGLEQVGGPHRLRYVGPCVCRGELHDLGDYPGLLRAHAERETNARVHGELFTIVDPGIASALDRFEGFREDRPDASLYLREYVELLEPQGERAWLYIYNQPLPFADPGRTKIASGDWRAYFEARTGQGGRSPSLGD